MKKTEEFKPGDRVRVKESILNPSDERFVGKFGTVHPDQSQPAFPGAAVAIYVIFDDETMWAFWNEEIEKVPDRRFYVQTNVGLARYLLNHHDGTKKHQDGSDAWDATIFKNKKKLEARIKELKAAGYRESK